MINKKRLLSTFINLVQIDSTSGNENNIALFVADKLKSFGGHVFFDKYGNVIGRFKGQGESIMLNSHLDTVEPGRNVKPIVTGDKITSDGTSILGADAKSGVSSILEAVESITENNAKHAPIEVVFTIAEEIGLLGAVNLDYSQLDSKIGITLDGVKSINHITNASPGYARVDIDIKGRSAHAGFDPENGLSAIVIAADVVSKLKLGRIDEETTANIGLISGGTARNAVPETVHLRGEIRSISQTKLKRHIAYFQKVINQALDKNQEAKIEMIIAMEFYSYALARTSNIVQQTILTLKKMGLKPVLEASGGGSDVNIFNTKGIETICVGAGFYNPHTTREYTLISEMLQGARFCEEIVSN